MEVSKKSRKKKSRALKRQQEKKEKKLLKQARKAKPALTDAAAPKTGGAPAQDPAPQKETGGVSALPKAQGDSEDEIPLLVPLEETPAAGSTKVFSLILVPIVGGSGAHLYQQALLRGRKCYTWEAALVKICEPRDEKYQGEPQEPLTDSASLLKYWSDV